MSMPKLPEENNINREEAVNLILTSIAMEELGLSHILNAEGEKLQYVLGTAEGTAGLDEPPTVEDILEVNKSVRQTLSNATRLQMMLGTKMESAMSTSTMQGEQGPEGPRGPAGPQGIQGIAGTVGTIKGSYDTPEELFAAHETGNPGDFYYVNPNLWVWDEDNDKWVNVGEIAGPQGLQGIQGERGDTGPVGPTGSTGPRGETGAQGPTGPRGDKGEQGPAGTAGTASTIIPFASGFPVAFEVTTTRSQVAFIGFGSSTKIVAPADPIHLPHLVGDSQLAFSMPDDGKITALTAFISLTAAGTSNTDVFIRLYISNTPNNIFTPIGDSITTIKMTIPAMTIVEWTSSGNQDLSVEVTKGTRVLVAVYAVSSLLGSTPSFHVSGGIKIESK